MEVLSNPGLSRVVKYFVTGRIGDKERHLMAEIQALGGCVC